MSERYFETDFSLDGTLDEAIETAVEYREDTARSFGTQVGAAVEMFDGSVYGGFNLENKGHDGIHAERMAINNALDDGYNATDFKSLVIVYQDEAHDDTEIFPSCLRCQAWAWDYTHPKLDLVVADSQGEPLYRTRLDEIIDPPGPAEPYPSNKIRGSKQLSNSEPRLPLDDQLDVFYEEDDMFRKFCDIIGVEGTPDTA